jgi:hypothetical protein
MAFHYQPTGFCGSWVIIDRRLSEFFFDPGLQAFLFGMISELLVNPQFEIIVFALAGFAEQSSLQFSIRPFIFGGFGF